MRRIIIMLAFAALTLGVAACNSSSNKNAKENAKPKGKYYCTMHPEITSDKPGTCPKCRMDLVQRDTIGK